MWRRGTSFEGSVVHASPGAVSAQGLCAQTDVSTSAKAPSPGQAVQGARACNAAGRVDTVAARLR
eukprot:5885754-Pyramimonas_sp.AAC.1